MTWPDQTTWAEVETALTRVVTGLSRGHLRIPPDADGIEFVRVTSADLTLANPAEQRRMATVVRYYPHGHMTAVAAVCWVVPNVRPLDGCNEPALLHTAPPRHLRASKRKPS